MANIFDLQATISLNGDAFMDGVNQASTAFQGMSNTVSAGAVAIGNILAQMATKAASALADFAKSAVDTGMAFDTSMSNVKAISGATGEEFDELREKAKQMGATTKFTATEAADAFSYMAMAGWKTGDMLDGIEGIMNLAAASGEDLARTSDIVTDALTAFGLSASDSGHFADVLAAASSNANTNVGMMGDTFKYVAPVAGALGYSVEDVAAAIGLMANSGIKASQAGTALRAALSRLVKPTDDVADALDELGLMKLADDTGEFEYNLEDLDKEIQAVDKAQTALNKAIEKYGIDSTQAVEKGQKLAEAQAKLSRAMDAQREDALSYNAALVDANGDMLSFADTIQNLREAFGELSAAEQAEYAARIFGQEAMSGMLAIINSTQEDYDKLTAAISASSEAADGQGAAFAMAQTQIDNLEGAVTIFHSALDGLKVAIYDTFSGELQNAVEVVTGAVSAMTEGFNEGGLQGAVSSLGEYIAAAFSEMIPPIDLSKSALAEFGNELQFWVGDSVSDFTGKIADLGRTFLSVSVETITSAADAIKGFIGAFDKEDVAIIMGKFTSALTGFYGAFLDAYNATIRDSGEAIQIFLEKFDKEGAAQAITDITDKAADLFSAFSTESADRIGKITDKFAGFQTRIAEIAAAFPIDFGKMGEAISGLIETFTEFGVKMEEFTRPIKDFFGNTLGSLIKSAVGAVVGAVGGIVNALSDLISFVNHNLRSTFALFTGDFTAWVQEGKQAWTELWEFIKDLWDAIVGLFRGAIDEFVGVGEDIVGGIKQGFINAWEGLKSFVTSMVSGLVAGVKSILQIGSPSKVFAKIGGFIVEGMEQGWSSEFDTFEDEVSSSLTDLTGTAQIGFDASALGRSSAAQITSTMAAGQSASGAVEINLVLDGDVAAKAIYDPLRRVAWQKGEGGAVYA